jgi:hypothetical protein
MRLCIEKYFTRNNGYTFKLNSINLPEDDIINYAVDNKYIIRDAE